MPVVYITCTFQCCMHAIASLHAPSSRSLICPSSPHNCSHSTSGRICFPTHQTKRQPHAPNLISSRSSHSISDVSSNAQPGSSTPFSHLSPFWGEVFFFLKKRKKKEKHLTILHLPQASAPPSAPENGVYRPLDSSPHSLPPCLAGPSASQWRACARCCPHLKNSGARCSRHRSS